jgi:hypothetical protein
MYAKARATISKGGKIYLAHLSGVVIGVALGVGFVGFSVGFALDNQCRATLTHYIAQH